MREGIGRDQRTLHADRGAPLTSGTGAEVRESRGVAQRHSRPTMSNDNPSSEAQVGTLKYGPTFADRFAGQAAAPEWVAGCVAWYHTKHRHTGIGLLPPQVVHQGQTAQVVAARQETLERAATAHPERFVAGLPKPPHFLMQGGSTHHSTRASPCPLPPSHHSLYANCLPNSVSNLLTRSELLLQRTYWLAAEVQISTDFEPQRVIRWTASDNARAALALDPPQPIQEWQRATQPANAFAG